MKKILMTLLLVINLISSSLCSIDVHAARSIDYYKAPQVVRATCYVQTGITKSGQHTREGVLAGRKEWLGCAAVLYKVNKNGTIGEAIGIYEFLDTGGTKGLNNGTVIDVWVDGMDGLETWVNTYGDYVYLQIIPAQG